MESDETLREELEEELGELMGLTSWDEDDEARYQRVVDEYPKETEEDLKYLSWMEEAAFLMRVA